MIRIPLSVVRAYTRPASARSSVDRVDRVERDIDDSDDRLGPSMSVAASRSRRESTGLGSIKLEQESNVYARPRLTFTMKRDSHYSTRRSAPPSAESTPWSALPPLGLPSGQSGAGAPEAQTDQMDIDS